MKSKQHSHKLLALPIFVLLFSLLACQSGNILSTGTPIPTPTPYPPSTTTPLPAELFFENFEGDTSCFETYSDSGAQMLRENGIFSISVNVTNMIYWALCSSQSFGDFNFEVDIKVPESTTGEYYYGVAFRVTGEQYYSFTVDTVAGQNPVFCINYIQGETLFPLTGSSLSTGNCWVKVPYNIYDPYSNKFRVNANGDIIKVYLNDEILALVRDDTLVVGKIGLVVGTFDTEGLEVVFDNVRITEP